MRTQKTTDDRTRYGIRRVRWQLSLAVAVGVVVLAASTLSASAKTPHTAVMSGRAYTLAADLGLLGNPETTLISPVPDTGLVSTPSTSTTAPSCIDIPAGLLVAHALCDTVATHEQTTRVSAQSTLADLSINVPGVPVIQLRGVKAWSTITCGSNRGMTTIAFLKIGGKNVISRVETFSNGKTIVVGPVTIVIDTVDRTGPPSRSRTVTAIHIKVDLPNVALLDVVVGVATAGVTNCPSAQPE